MDTSEAKKAIAAPPKRSWRRHSEEFKARVIELARQPNTSVAAVALANGLNANMLRRWVRDSELGDTGAEVRPLTPLASLPAFVQVPIQPPPSLPPAAAQQASPRIDVDIHRNATHVRASLPLDSRSAAWLREVMG